MPSWNTVAKLDYLLSGQFETFAGNAVAISVEQAKAARHARGRPAPSRAQGGETDLERFTACLVIEPSR
jgi:hypothetical protein